MNKKIVIKSFSALSCELMVQGPETGDPGLPCLANQRLRFISDSVRGLDVQPDRLRVARPVEARPAFEKALNTWRGEGTDNPRMWGLSHGC
jgi:hypothetical protein